MLHVKHERVHQCIRCEDYDPAHEWCYTYEADIYDDEATKMRYCPKFRKKRKKVG